MRSTKNLTLVFLQIKMKLKPCSKIVDLVSLITYLYQHFPVFFNVFVRHFLFLFLLSLYRFVNIHAKFFAKNKKKIFKKRVSLRYSFL